MKKRILFTWIFPLNEKSGGIERVTNIIINQLRLNNYDCEFLEFNENNDIMIYNNNNIYDLNEFLLSNNFDVIINQNGGSTAFTNILENTSWSGKYIICYHLDPISYMKLYSLERCLMELFKTNNLFVDKIKWFLRAIFFNVRAIHLKNKLSYINNLNYKNSNIYVLLSQRFFDNFKSVSNLKNYSKLKAINNPLSFDINIGILEILKKRNEVLIVARMDDAQKRIQFALKIWRRIEKNGFEDWKLNIVGDGKDLLYYKKIAQNYGLERVFFHGNKDPLPFYLSASIFMMTSRTEGWGMTITESLQTGVIPIAMNSYASLNDIIIDGYNGIIIKNNSLSDYYNNLYKLMLLPSRVRINYALNCITSSCKFSKHLIINEWIKLIEYE